MAAEQVKVRAIPLAGHKHRIRCGIRWGTVPVLVSVVDAPAPVKDGAPAADGMEISPAQLVELQADQQIAVNRAGEAAVEADALNGAKAEIVALQRALDDARREASALSEEGDKLRALLKDQEIATGSKIAELTAALEAAKARKK